jgi:putative resolvase
MYIPSRKAAQILGLHPNTLRKWADDGRIQHIRTESGQRLYDVDSYLGNAAKRTVVCYCRVSSYSQKDDLTRQVSFLRERYPNAEIVKDIGSGLNYKRKGLKSILGRCLRGEKLEVVVAHRDRLARFGFEILEWIIRERGGKLVVLDDAIREPEQELTEDLLTLIHVFSCRLIGMRNDKDKKDKDDAKRVAAEAARYVVEHL